MSQAPPSTRKDVRLMTRVLIALISPINVSEPLARADYDDELSRNVGLREGTPTQQAQQLENNRKLVSERLRLLRGRLAVSFFSMTSAVASAAILPRWGIGIPTSSAVLAIGSLFCFAWATLGRLGWAGQSFKGTTVIERLDQKLFHVLYWIGMYLGTLAVL